MGGKHLKRLRAEKSKVQLKKKTLAKAQNITNTAFTVKKILTVEQLQKVDKDEPVSNWNIPLKDLLIRLNHHNFTARLNSLTGIKELLTKYPKILEGPSLKLLISRLLELLTDEEHKIRVTAIDLLSHVFDLISNSSILAFQKFLNLHLGCAMTHRNASIQQDSLRLIDVVVKHSPEVIKCNFKTIAQNFVRIMKSYFYESHSGVFSTGKSKQDLEKGKREMLLRFHQFIIAGYPAVTEEKQSDWRNRDHNNINVFLSQKTNLRVLNQQYKEIPDLMIFKNSDKENLLGGLKSSEFMNFCSLVIPLLFDTWIEFSPHEGFDKGPECVLTEGGGELLCILLRILLFLYDMAVAIQDPEVEDWFITNYGGTFKKSFMLNFPYLSGFSTKMSKGGDLKEFPKGFNVYMLPNLIICYLAYSLKLVEKNSKLENKMENYVSGALMMIPQEVDILLKVVTAGLHASKQRKSNVILSKVVAAYDSAGNPDFQRHLSKILMNTALGENGKICQEDEGVRNWMNSLPKRLCQLQVFVEELETILKLITTSTGVEVLREIERNANEIFNNIENIKIEGINEFEGQKMIADILYRCNCEVLTPLMKNEISERKIRHPNLRKYILAIFSQKLSDKLDFCKEIEFFH